MFDLTLCSKPAEAPLPAVPPAGASARALAGMLDVVDYGMLLLDASGAVIFANQVARFELDGAHHPLQLQARQLRARRTGDAAALEQALTLALQRGRQSMLTLGRPVGGPGAPVSLSVVPLPGGDDGPVALVVFGKREVGEELSIDAFARGRGMTAAETRVLKLLCRGRRPGDIAQLLGVQLCTVRTQVLQLRAKTGAADIGALVQCVARLPPMACVMRQAA